MSSKRKDFNSAKLRDNYKLLEKNDLKMRNIKLSVPYMSSNASGYDIYGKAASRNSRLQPALPIEPYAEKMEKYNYSDIYPAMPELFPAYQDDNFAKLYEEHVKNINIHLYLEDLLPGMYVLEGVRKAPELKPKEVAINQQEFDYFKETALSSQYSSYTSLSNDYAKYGTTVKESVFYKRSVVQYKNAPSNRDYLATNIPVDYGTEDEIQKSDSIWLPVQRIAETVASLEEEKKKTRPLTPPLPQYIADAFSYYDLVNESADLTYRRNVTLSMREIYTGVYQSERYYTRDENWARCGYNYPISYKHEIASKTFKEAYSQAHQYSALYYPFTKSDARYSGTVHYGSYVNKQPIDYHQAQRYSLPVSADVIYARSSQQHQKSAAQTNSTRIPAFPEIPYGFAQAEVYKDYRKHEGQKIEYTQNASSAETSEKQYRIKRAHDSQADHQYHLKTYEEMHFQTNKATGKPYNDDIRGTNPSASVYSAANIPTIGYYAASLPTTGISPVIPTTVISFASKNDVGLPPPPDDGKPAGKKQTYSPEFFSEPTPQISAPSYPSALQSPHFPSTDAITGSNSVNLPTYFKYIENSGPKRALGPKSEEADSAPISRRNTRVLGIPVELMSDDQKVELSSQIASYRQQLGTLWLQYRQQADFSERQARCAVLEDNDELARRHLLVRRTMLYYIDDVYARIDWLDYMMGDLYAEELNYLKRQCAEK